MATNYQILISRKGEWETISTAAAASVAVRFAKEACLLVPSGIAAVRHNGEIVSEYWDMGDHDIRTIVKKPI